MKRVIVDHYGGPEVLRVIEDDVPEPGPGEVRVAALAFPDLHRSRIWYQWTRTPVPVSHERLAAPGSQR